MPTGAAITAQRRPISQSRTFQGSRLTGHILQDTSPLNTLYYLFTVPPRYLLHKLNLQNIKFLSIYQDKWHSPTPRSNAATTIMTTNFPCYILCGLNNKVRSYILHTRVTLPHSVLNHLTVRGTSHTCL